VPERTAAGLIFLEGILEPPRGARLTGGADHVDEGAQRARYLAVSGIVKEQPLESQRPTLEHADELTRAQERLRQYFGRKRKPQSIDGGP
jgi:hypothetical protein